ncbi:MAG: PAS domain S-box protein [Roseiflexaceae bacterium]|nr:PAS domain S-box protein [Roseiflexaceae bacterium]
MNTNQTLAPFQALLEAAPDAMLIVDAEGRIALLNRQAELMFGFGRAALLHQPMELLLPDQLHQRHAQHRASYAAAPHTRPMGVGLDLMARRSNGQIFPVEISLSPLQTPDGLHVIAVIRDISARKHAADELERQVQQRTAHLNALLRLSQELLSIRSLDAVLQRALDSAMLLASGASSSAIYLIDPTDQQLALRASTGFRQLPPLRLAGQADLPEGSLSVPMTAHGQSIGALVLLPNDPAGPFAPGTLITLEGLANLTAAAIWADQRASETALLSRRLLDLEAQQHTMTARLSSAEAAIMQAARLAAVGQLAASVAHEINNPLYATRNALHLLEEELPADARQSPYLGIARDELARIARVIERMRDFYRPSRGEMVPYQLNQALEATLELAVLNMRYSSIQLIFTPATDLPEVTCNPDQLRQVFLNLMLNAIDAMPDGGTLTVRSLAGANVALIEVRDTGIGIPEAVRARLFEPFFTNKPNGTGLGLSISAHIVTQHGGQIEVESREGQGSLFRVILPYAGHV